MSSLVYLDSSALVKLVLPEPETDALLAYLEDRPARVSSEIAIVEVLRAARRASSDRRVEARARDVLAAIDLLRLATAELGSAALIEPVTLRALDAIHVASAASLDADLGALVTYDLALARAAESMSLPVLAPGR